MLQSSIGQLFDPLYSTAWPHVSLQSWLISTNLQFMVTLSLITWLRVTMIEIAKTIILSLHHMAWSSQEWNYKNYSCHEVFCFVLACYCLYCHAAMHTMSEELSVCPILWTSVCPILWAIKVLRLVFILVVYSSLFYCFFFPCCLSCCGLLVLLVQWWLHCSFNSSVDSPVLWWFKESPVST